MSRVRFTDMYLNIIFIVSSCIFSKHGSIPRKVEVSEPVILQTVNLDKDNTLLTSCYK